MAPKNPKTSFFSAKSQEVMNRLGLDPERLKRENTPEVMIPKMAIVGFLDTVEQFAKIGKQTVSASVQGLNLAQMRLFLGAIRGTLDMIDQSLLAYEAALRQTKVKDMVDTLAKAIRTNAQEDEDDPTDRDDADDDADEETSPEETEEDDEDVADDDNTDDEEDDPDPDEDAFASHKKRSIN
jgi:hypothetical protein